LPTPCGELRANVSYAVLLGLVVSLLLGGIAMFMDTTRPLNRPVTTFLAFLGVHLLLTIFMVLKRTRAMFFALTSPEREKLP
jgi:hypothetical protein